MEENRNKNIIEERIENRVQLTKVYLGSGDDYIVLSGNDISIFDKFLAAGDNIISLSNAMEESIKEIKNKVTESDDQFSEASEIIGERKKFSEEAANIMDSVLGKDATKKFFGDVYKEIPDFLPDVECFLDFFDSLVPVIEKLSGHKEKLEKLANRQRMGKYKPQDYMRK